MKTVKLVLLGFLLSFAVNASAQVNVNVNIGPPAWGPPAPATVRYYYIPDIEVYYEVPTARYIYMGPSGWIYVKKLPARYAHYDFYSGHTVVLDYRGDAPYRFYKEHKVKYPKGYKKGGPKKGGGHGHGKGHGKGK